MRKLTSEQIKYNRKVKQQYIRDAKENKKKKEQKKMNYLKTKKCKRCNKTGKVKLITITKKWNGYVCDNCNWYFSIDKRNKRR